MKTEPDDSTSRWEQQRRRRIIQIAVSESDESDAKVVALCNDGTVWWRYLEPITAEGGDWQRIKDIPKSLDLYRDNEWDMKKNRPQHVVQWVREQLGLSQPQLAQVIGMNIFTLQSVETARLRLSEKNANRLSAVTGVDPSWFINNKLDPPLPDPAAMRAHFDEAQPEMIVGICGDLPHKGKNRPGG